MTGSNIKKMILYVLAIVIMLSIVDAYLQSFKDFTPYTDNTNTGQYGELFKINDSTNKTLKNVTIATGDTSTFVCIYLYSPWTNISCSPVNSYLALFNVNLTNGTDYVIWTHKEGASHTTKYNSTITYPYAPIESYKFIRWTTGLSLGTVYPPATSGSNSALWLSQISYGFENITAASTPAPKLNILSNFTSLFTSETNFSFKFNLSEENNGAWDGSNCSIYFDGVLNYTVYDPTTDTYPDTGDDIYLNFSYPNTEKDFIFNMTCIGISNAGNPVANVSTPNYHIIVDNIFPRITTDFTNNTDYYLLDTIATNFNFSDMNISYYSILFLNSAGTITENYSDMNYLRSAGENDTTRSAITLGYNFTIRINITDRVNNSLYHVYFYDILTSSGVSVNLSKLENLTAQNVKENKKIGEALTMIGWVLLIIAFLILGLAVNPLFWLFASGVFGIMAVSSFVNATADGLSLFAAADEWPKFLFFLLMFVLFGIASLILYITRLDKGKDDDIYQGFYSKK